MWVLAPFQLHSAEPRAALELPQPSVRGPGFHRGASIGFFLEERDPFFEVSHYSELINRAVSAGATHVQLALRWFQDDVGANEIAPGPRETVSDTVLTAVIRAAHSRGLRVFLMPFVFVRDKSAGSWRGAIAPTDPDVWWSAYESYILKYARLAQRERVETFAVGSELKSMVHEEARWRALIKAVRRDYEGQLVYSANWDNYTQVGFWDELDVIGLNGYFSLSRTYRPDLETLRSAWQIVRRRLMDWAGGLARPILLTEVGYRSSVIAPAEPWSHFDMPAAAPDVQLKCFEAFYSTWSAEGGLQGLYVWNWFGDGGMEESGFTPYGKPAFEVIRHWYFNSWGL